MFKRGNRLLKGLFRSKYLDLNIEDMPLEEFSRISRGIYLDIIFRVLGSLVLFIICIVAFILGGRYAW